MPRIVHFDASAGASGDMILGALVDLGLSLDALGAQLDTLGLPGFRLEARSVERSGVRATKLDVVPESRDHAHRGLKEILGLLQASYFVSQPQPTQAARQMPVNAKTQ